MSREIERYQYTNLRCTTRKSVLRGELQNYGKGNWADELRGTSRSPVTPP